MRAKAAVLGMRGLLQSIERLVQATNIVGSGGVNKTSWLNAVNYLYQGAMKEGILHIKLMNGLGARQCQSENHPNSCWLDDRAKSLIIINSWTLCKTTKNPPDFYQSREPSDRNL